MIRYIVIQDDDQGRTYELQVSFKCCEEIGGAPAICCDVDAVVLEGLTVWCGAWGMECEIPHDRRRFVERWIQHKYADEITERCIAIWDNERRGAA